MNDNQNHHSNKNNNDGSSCSRKRPRNNSANKNNKNDSNDNGSLLSAAALTNKTKSFVASAVWTGAREGYFFGTGDEGTGYYLDDSRCRPEQQQQQPQQEEKKKNKNRMNKEEKQPPEVVTAAVASSSSRTRTVVIAEERNETHLIDSGRVGDGGGVDDDDYDNNKNANNNNENEGLLLLSRAEEESAESSKKVVELSIKGLDQAKISLIKAWERNQLHRAKYNQDSDNDNGNHPAAAYEYIMESEVALYECIASLQGIASSPERLYGPLLQTGIPTTLLQIAAQHENNDILTAVWAVWAEWIDSALLVPPQEEDTTNVAKGLSSRVVRPVVELTRHLIYEAGGLELLMESLGRFEDTTTTTSTTTTTNTNDPTNEDEDDVGQGVGDILTVVEQILEMDSMLAILRAEQQQQQENNNNNNNNNKDGTFPTLTPPSTRSTATNQKQQHQTTVTQIICQPKLGFVAWLLEHSRDNDDSDKKKKETTTTHDNSSSNNSNNNKWKDRSLELLTLLAPREELYQILPDWSALTTYQASWSSLSSTSKTTSTTMTTTTTLDGLEILLQGVAKYRKHQPATDEELNALENRCIIVDAALTYSSINVKHFVSLQGCELVIRCLKERVHAGGLALKWLDFSGSGSTTTTTTTTASTSGTNSGKNDNDIQQEHYQIHQQACVHMVAHASALKFLLPLFMDRNKPKMAIFDATTTTTTTTTHDDDSNHKKNKKQAKRQRRKKKEWNTMMEQTVIRILYTLTRYLPDTTTTTGVNNNKDPLECQARLIGKFADDSLKCDRLVELLLAYDLNARTAEYEFYRYSEMAAVEDDDDDDGEEKAAVVAAAVLEAKLAGGGDLFHRLGAMAAFLACHSKQCHTYLSAKLRQQQSGMGLVTTACEEFLAVVRHDSDSFQKLQSYLQHLS